MILFHVLLHLLSQRKNIISQIDIAYYRIVIGSGLSHESKFSQGQSLGFEAQDDDAQGEPQAEAILWLPQNTIHPELAQVDRMY